MNPNPWHGYRECVFVLMRQIGEEAMRHDRAALRLAPGWPDVPIGAAHFDERLKAEALYDFLRAMNRDGADPQTAAAKALEQSRALVRKWNANPQAVSFGGPASLHRWEDTCAAMLEDRARRFAGIGPPDFAHLTESQIFET